MRLARRGFSISRPCRSSRPRPAIPRDALRGGAPPHAASFAAQLARSAFSCERDYHSTMTSATNQQWICRTTGAAAVAVAALTSPLIAHAPYERVRATIVDPAGRQLQVVARYVDGIIGSDPVTISVRTADGVVVARAEEARDAIVQCPSFEACQVFLYDPPFNLFPQRVLRLTQTGFAEDTASRYRLFGVLLPVRHHFAELVIQSLMLAVVPLLAQFLVKRKRTPLVIAAWFVFVPVAVLWLSVSWLGISLNSLVSVVWLATAVAMMCGLPVMLRAFKRRVT